VRINVLGIGNFHTVQIDMNAIAVKRCIFSEQAETLVGRPPAFLDKIAKFLKFAFRAKKSTEPLLCQLASFFIFGIPQQLHYSSLIRGKPSNLPNDTSDEFSFL